MSATQLEDLPEIEYLDGRPYPKVSPKARHAAVQGNFIRILHRCLAEHGFIGPELRFYLTPGRLKGTSFVPDVAFVRRERFLSVPPEQRDDPPFAPDVVVEVRSPSDDLRFLAQKIARYFAHGAQLVFDVEPAERVLRVHSAQGVRTLTADQQFVDAAIPALRFSVAELFAGLDEYGL